MAEENVEFPKPNMTGDRGNTNLYCFSGGAMLAKERGSPFDLVATYPVDTYISDSVSCVQFDGYYYWSMEPQTNGVTIKKWEIDSGILRQRSVYSFADTTQQKYDSQSFAVDSYSDVLAGIAGTAGSSTLEVSDVDIFDLGDEIVIGPSTHSSYNGEYEKRTVANKSGSNLILDLPLTKSFMSGDPVYTNRFFYLFNKYSPYDESRGSLLKYRSEDGILYSFHSSHMFADVTASCFYDSKILFIKGHELIYLTPSSLTLYRHLAIDNLQTDRANINPIYALWVYSDTLYRLQGVRVYWDDINDIWEEDDWSPYYNYVDEAIPAVAQALVYFVNLDVYPDFIHAIATGVTTAESDVTVTVLNQDRTPLSGRSVVLTSTHGTLVPNNGLTDSDGQFTSTYNGTSDITEVEITATVT